MRRLRGERGGILVLSAVTIPVFLLLAALVVDAGNWFTHKRQLQTRADAGALAAGVEYISQLQNCLTAPGTTGTAISDVAKRYAGTEEAIAGTKYNQNITKQSELTVKVNSLGAGDADWSDGGSPCTPHTTGDSISPNPNSLWTDVKVRETDLGTLFSTFGINLPQVTAQARVEVKQLIGVKHGGLPFVAETGDYVDCAWAEFVQADNPNIRVPLIGTSNPVLLTKDPSTPRRWTADVGGIDIGASTKDVGVVYWMGTKTGGACDFNTQQKGFLPSDGNGNPVPIDRISIYEDDSPKKDEAPMLKHFTLTPGTCGPDRVGFIYSPVACNVTFTAEVASGPNPLPGKVIVESSNPAVPPVTVAGSGPYYTGQLTLDPNAVTGASVTGDYTQVGQHRLKVRWEQTSGKVGAKTCTPAAPCTGTFLSNESPSGSNVQHSTYLADPLNSNPLFSAELMSGGAPMQNSWAASGPDTGPFKVVVTNLGVDQDHVVTIRDSVQSSGNRTATVDCGQGNGTSGLQDAILNGCPVPVTVNQRNDSCSPAPPLPSGAWDCVSTVPGNKTATNKGFDARFTCSMPNNWVAGASPGNLSDDDPRYAYIFLTSFGMTANVNPNNWLPIKAFLRVYVTGWDGKSGPASCADNDYPPRGYDGKGAQLWGHLVDVITLSDDVIPGDPECDLTTAITTCKPVLVR